MLAVDPEAQRQGLGRALTDHATVWLCDAGMRAAISAPAVTPATPQGGGCTSEPGTAPCR
jgi:GNAT superfamily N-acetyltransferase